MPELYDPPFSSSGHLSPDLSPPQSFSSSMINWCILPFPSLLSSSVQSQGAYPIPFFFFFCWDCISQGDRDDEGGRGVVTTGEKKENQSGSVWNCIWLNSNPNQSNTKETLSYVPQHFVAYNTNQLKCQMCQAGSVQVLEGRREGA